MMYSLEMMFDDVEPEANYGYADWQEQLLEEAWLEAIDNFEDDEIHKGEDPNELGE